MTRYEELEQLAASCSIKIHLGILREDDALDGYYIALRDGSCLILINRHRPLAQRTAALAEELGHHFKSIGDLRDLRDIAAAKSERLAHDWSIESLLPMPALESQLQQGNGTVWELAEACDLPAEFIREAAAYHSRKQPRRITVKDLPPQLQKLIKTRAEREAPQVVPELPPPPQPPQPTVAEIRPRALKRAEKILKRKLSNSDHRAISYAFRTEIIFERRISLDFVNRDREPNTPGMSWFIRRIYRELFE